jgi:hypothetical protein
MIVYGTAKKATAPAPKASAGTANEGIGRIEVAPDQEPGDDGSEPSTSQSPFVQQVEIAPPPPRGSEAQPGYEGEQRDENDEGSPIHLRHGILRKVPSRPRAPPARCFGWSLVLGRKVNYCGQDGAEDDPEQLVPIEERQTDQRRFDPVVERRPENRDELNKKEQVPPAPSAALARLLVHPHRCFSLDLRSDNASCHAAFHRATVRVRRPPKICADGNPTDLHQ